MCESMFFFRFLVYAHKAILLPVVSMYAAHAATTLF